jgi:hypothetical protein
VIIEVDRGQLCSAYAAKRGCAVWRLFRDGRSRREGQEGRDGVAAASAERSQRAERGTSDDHYCRSETTRCA